MYGWLVLLAMAIHAPLLLFHLQSHSYDANTHMFFAAHYAHHWFNPWNEKWFAGFSQTTYPPLVHQLIALFSHIVGLTMGYTIVQAIVIMLLPIGVYRYSRLWVSERASMYAAIGSIFLGSLAEMVYEAGQINTTFASVMVLNALPFIYVWIREGRALDFWKGLAVFLVGAAGHHVTVIFGTIFFGLPIIWLAFIDHREDRADATAKGISGRTLLFAVASMIGVAIVLLPYWIELYHNPIKQAPIFHESRSNYIMQPLMGQNFFLIPFGALLLAIPFIFWYGPTHKRVRPLFFGWWFTAVIGLGGTTPLPRWVLGRAWEILTYERFAYWATLMALPFAGIIAEKLIDRFRVKAVVALTALAILTCGSALWWLQYNPIGVAPFSVAEVANFLNRDNHAKFRYLTLGFGSELSKISIMANASSVDGDYNSARTLPELMAGGSGQLTNSKYFGVNGMEALRAMLKHADHYGLKYIFVHDPFYDPLLAFAGWRHIETFDQGAITLWSKEDVPPAHKIIPPPGAVPSEWEDVLWGTLPPATVVFALVMLLGFPERRRIAETIDFPAAEAEPVVLREAQ